jgi:hypothetical protein
MLMMTTINALSVARAKIITDLEMINIADRRESTLRTVREKEAEIELRKSCMS